MQKHEVLLVHILEKVDKMGEDVACIRVDQAEMKVDLKYHIKRTDLLEGEVKESKKVIKWLAAPIYAVRALLKWLHLL
jgi:hypothetical protein